MRPYLLAILSIALSVTAIAQPKEYTLTGTLGAASGEEFNYKIVLTDSSGKIRGFSYTWFKDKTNEDTKAAISGTIDRAAKTLSIKETEMVYNHDFYSQALICLVKCKMKIGSEKGHDVLAGAFTSANTFGTACDGGVLRFENEAVIRELFAETMALPVANVPKKSSGPRIVVYDTASRPASAPVETVTKITAGVEKIYDWNTDSLVVDIWDGGKIDGDNITVIWNNEIVLSRHTIAANKRQLRLAVPAQDISKLVIVANNTGNEPPNTANITLHDGDTAYPVLAYNEAGNQGVIRIKRKGK